MIERAHKELDMRNRTLEQTDHMRAENVLVIQAFIARMLHQL
jgi:hypothetical protein